MLLDRYLLMEHSFYYPTESEETQLGAQYVLIVMKIPQAPNTTTASVHY